MCGTGILLGQISWTFYMRISIMKFNRLIKGVIGSLSLCAIPSIALAGQYTSTYSFKTPEVQNLPNGQQLIILEDTWQDSAVIGAPVLPSKFSNILIPGNEMVVSIDIETGDEIALPGAYDIAHAKKPVRFSFSGPIVPTPQDELIYSADKFYPYSDMEQSTLRHLKGATIQKTEINPVKYNPITGEVFYYSTIKVTVNTQDAPASASSGQSIANFRGTSADNAIILSNIDNKDALNTGMQPAAVINGARQFLVITTAELVDTFTKLTDYRSSYQGGGYTTHIETMENIEANYVGIDRAEKLRNYIKDSYQNYGTQYVVLGGDADGSMEEQMIPTRGVYANVGGDIDENIPSDLYFACLDGSWNGDGDEFWGEPNDGFGGNTDIDWDPEVYVGRIAADDATEANNHIDKIIAFETAPSHQQKALLVGEKLDEYIARDGSTVHVWGKNFLKRIEEAYSSDITVDWLTDADLNEEGVAGYPDNTWNKQDLINKINSDEYLIINHDGHSSNTYNMRLEAYGQIDDIASLNNSNFFLAYSVGCYAYAFDNRFPSGNYTSYDSLGESLTNSYGDRGAFAAIGNSRYGWYNSTPSLNSTGVHKAFIESIYQNGNSKIGKALQDSKVNLHYANDVVRWVSFDTNLLGDPASLIKDFIKVGGCDAITATLAEHEAAGRAVKKYGILYYAVGSNQYLGSNGATTVSLSEDGQGSWVKGECSNTNVAPEVTSITAEAEGPHLTIYGSAIDNNGDLVRIEVELNNSGDWVSAYGLSNWIYTFQDMQAGDHIIKARAIDSNGAVSSEYELLVNFDAPSAPIIEYVTHSIQNTTFIAEGTVSDINDDVAYVRVVSDQFEATGCDGTSNFRCSVVELEKGQSYDIYLEAEDIQGNVSELYGPIEVVMPGDHAPVIESYEVNVTGSTITVSGTSSDIDGDIKKTILAIGGAGIVCEGAENWVCTVTNAPTGTFAAQIRVSDSYNNRADSEYFNITVDGSAKPIIDSYNWSQNGNTVTVTGTASDADGDLSEIIVDGTPGNASCSGTDSFTCTVSDLAPGTYTFSLIAMDAEGNSSDSTGYYTFTVEEAGECITATNYQHIQDGRAYAGGLMNMYAYAQGTDDDLGLAGSTYYSATTSLEETSSGVWAKVSNCN